MQPMAILSLLKLEGLTKREGLSKVKSHLQKYRKKVAEAKLGGGTASAHVVAVVADEEGDDDAADAGRGGAAGYGESVSDGVLGGGGAGGVIGQGVYKWVTDDAVCATRGSPLPPMSLLPLPPPLQQQHHQQQSTQEQNAAASVSASVSDEGNSEEEERSHLAAAGAESQREAVSSVGEMQQPQQQPQPLPPQQQQPEATTPEPTSSCKRKLEQVGDPPSPKSTRVEAAGAAKHTVGDSIAHSAEPIVCEAVPSDGSSASASGSCANVEVRIDGCVADGTLAESAAAFTAEGAQSDEAPSCSEESFARTAAVLNSIREGILRHLDRQEELEVCATLRDAR